MLIATIMIIATITGLAAPCKHNAADQIIQAERDFCAMGLEQGTSAAFVRYLADSGIVFRPRPVLGKPLFRSRPADAATLTWRPRLADMACGGDMGYTTGPYVYAIPEGPGKGEYYGQYVTVWQKHPDGTWKIAVDAGIDHPQRDATDTSVTIKEHHHNTKQDTLGQPAIERDALMFLDRAMSGNAKDAGHRDAIRQRYAEGVTVLKDGALPATGVEAITRSLLATGSEWQWDPLDAGISMTGDMGYSYGIAHLKPAADTAKNGQYSYLRVWRNRDGRGWRIELELLTRIPEAK
jgi:ketosteroid isomerase-like protein